MAGKFKLLNILLGKMQQMILLYLKYYIFQLRRLSVRPSQLTFFIIIKTLHNFIFEADLRVSVWPFIYTNVTICRLNIWEFFPSQGLSTHLRTFCEEVQRLLAANVTIWRILICCFHSKQRVFSAKTWDNVIGLCSQKVSNISSLILYSLFVF